MKTNVIFLALSLSTAAATLGQSSPYPNAGSDLYAARNSATNPAEDQPESMHLAQLKPHSVRLTPANGATKPTNVVYAGTVNAAIYPVINSVKVRLAIENPQRISLRFRLLNERGEVLYAQRVPRGCNVSMQYLDMERMPDGAYTLEINDGVTQWPLQFQLQSPTAVVPQRLIALN